jgi:hypothetical protein
MPGVKRIVCLANSRKPDGRCIAGVELTDQGRRRGWIRPVSARPNQAVSEDERQYSDGSDPTVLDIVDVPLLRHTPHTFQQENWLLDPEYYWQQAGRVSWGELPGLLDPVGPLWINGHSTYHGTSDRVPEDIAEQLSSSLVLIRVPAARLRVFAPGADFGNYKRRVQAQFEHAGERYRLRVTDPVYERRYLAEQDGFYDLGDCFLTVSLGEPWEGAAYKLVAAIIERPDD